MRTWRVGTVSMGMTLIFLGIVLVLSQVFNWKPAYVMISWWPIILIVLGVEVLVYLFSTKQENPIVRYDIFSIFFVGVIGVVGIGFATISATGILDKVYEWSNIEVKTLNLPTYSNELDESIHRIVVRVGPESLAVETGETNEVSVFGTYVANVGNGVVLIETIEDYLLTEQKGDTLFVTFKAPPQKFSPFDNGADQNATMVVPNNVQVDIDANHQSLYVNSRSLLNDWVIANARDVHLAVASDVDVVMNAEKIGHIHNDHRMWDMATKDEKNEALYEEQSGTLQLGKGTYMMNIMNASEIAVIKY